MRNIIFITTILAAMLFFVYSCDLQKDPIANFSDITNPQDTTDGEGDITTKEQIVALRNGLYSTIRDSQENWYLDLLVLTETHADNAYRGTSGNELSSLEAQSQDGINKNIARDWNSFLNYIVTANRIILNIDNVPDPALTTIERKHWKAEALIFRAWIWFDMVRLWGGIPLVTQKTPDVTADNIEEVYPQLFPARNTVEEVYAKIIEDLEKAVTDAPNVDVQNKFLLSKAVANALLAKVYSEKPVRDYAKVVTYCEKVESDGFTLVENYGDLFFYDKNTKDVKLRNSNESIFEITYPAGSTSWVWMMFGLNEADENSRYDWAKWITPSRDLIAAFQEENDEVRMNASIIWGNPSWSIHYPSSHYPFMYKTRSNLNSVIKLRLADILLLKAEAYVETGKLNEAESLVNQVRNRAKLGDLSSSSTSSKEKLKEAILKERRLELAFEGQRWFDLVRYEKAISTLNTLNQRDQGRIQMLPLTEETILLPVPQEAIDKNPSLIQNPGY
ncbi:MAG: RagB/SusD family nutrient uptake outer membrane protein [Dysgonamonadaceae bacterium]|nr:RagB/SusD family nutrient uptake outer membrane protein [Dysgonamonadaceae bacterium]